MGAYPQPDPISGSDADPIGFPYHVPASGTTIHSLAANILGEKCLFSSGALWHRWGTTPSDLRFSLSTLVLSHTVSMAASKPTVRNT